MKKLLALSALVAGAAFSQAAVIYDVVNNTASYSLFNTAGADRMGDNFLVADAGAGKWWRITEVQSAVFATLAGTYTNRQLTINIYNGTAVSGVATDPAFSSLAGTATVSFADLTTTANNSGQLVTVSGLAIDLAAAPVNASGYSIELVWSYTGPGILANGVKNGGSVATGSSWSNGFFADFAPNNDGVILQNEFYNGTGWTNGNLAVKLTADAVPEPTTLGLLGLGLAGLAARRRRSK